MATLWVNVNAFGKLKFSYFSEIFKFKFSHISHFWQNRRNVDWFKMIPNEVDSYLHLIWIKSNYSNVFGERYNHMYPQYVMEHQVQGTFWGKESVNHVLIEWNQSPFVYHIFSLLITIGTELPNICCHFTWQYIVWYMLLFTQYTGCALTESARHMTHVQPNQLNLFA